MSMPEPLCGICGIAAERVISRSASGIVAVPSQTARDGHVMVVSVTHARSFADLAPHDADALMSLVGSATRAAEEASGAEKCYVLRIGDKQPHLHFHIVPAAEVDPPLAPHVFGDRGWSAGVGADALAPASVFAPAFDKALRPAASRARIARAQVWLAGLFMALLGGSVAFAIAWPLIGPPFVIPVSVCAGLVTGRAADDRMSGIPVRWGQALLMGVLVAVAGYFLKRWLES